MLDQILGVRWYNAKQAQPTELRIRAVLFDLDGTVIDTEKLYVRFWREASAFYGFPMTLEQGLGMRSLNAVAGAARMKSYFGDGVEYEAVREKRKELMNAFIEQEGIEAKPGILPLLDYLRAHDIRAAIVTASPIDRAEAHLAAVGLAGQFDRIISAQQVAHGKPEPDVYLYAAAELGFAPEECIAVEDSPNGLLSASRAGCHPVLVPDLDESTPEVQALLLAQAERLDSIIGLLEALG